MIPKTVCKKCSYKLQCVLVPHCYLFERSPYLKRGVVRLLSGNTEMSMVLGKLSMGPQIFKELMGSIGARALQKALVLGYVKRRKWHRGYIMTWRWVESKRTTVSVAQAIKYKYYITKLGRQVLHQLSLTSHEYILVPHKVQMFWLFYFMTHKWY